MTHLWEVTKIGQLKSQVSKNYINLTLSNPQEKSSFIKSLSQTLAKVIEMRCKTPLEKIAKAKTFFLIFVLKQIGNQIEFNKIRVFPSDSFFVFPTRNFILFVNICVFDSIHRNRRHVLKTSFFVYWYIRWGANSYMTPEIQINGIRRREGLSQQCFFYRCLEIIFQEQTKWEKIIANQLLNPNRQSLRCYSYQNISINRFVSERHI